MTESAVTTTDLLKMAFSPDVISTLARWISIGWTVEQVQKNILHRYRSRIHGLERLLDPAFKDSESLNIRCSLDGNYLCTITACTPMANYKRIVLVWPGGRQEVWELTVDTSPRDGTPYIENFIYSSYQMDGNGIPHTLSSTDRRALLRQLQALK
jgi:hypothetical protein